MSEPASRQARIVAGVDGSPESVHALRWAVRQAELTGAGLQVVTAWQYPAFFGWAPSDAVSPDYAQLAGRTLDDALHQVFGSGRPGWVRAQAIEGHPAKVLVDTAVGADLLVVGCRGYGGLTDTLLGSVSTYCVHHAPGPVTVVRPAKRPR
jgi:nucleotide-binding universal stress UspA family protein